MKLILTHFALATALTAAAFAADVVPQDSPMRPATLDGSASTAKMAATESGPTRNASNGTIGDKKPWRCQYTVSVDSTWSTAKICTVPAGYRFVIENISGMLQMAAASKYDFLWIGTSLGGVEDVDFVPFQQRIYTQTLQRLQFNQQVKLYADGGTNIRFAMQGDFNYKTDGFWFTLTGHLELQ